MEREINASQLQNMRVQLEDWEESWAVQESGRFMDDTRGGQQVDPWQAWMSETKPEDGPEPKESR
eukprot:4387504-Amphidinium_carterae.1